MSEKIDKLTAARTFAELEEKIQKVRRAAKVSSITVYFSNNEAGKAVPSINLSLIDDEITEAFKDSLKDLQEMASEGVLRSLEEIVSKDSF